jgi:hypothetical protein
MCREFHSFLCKSRWAKVRRNRKPGWPPTMLVVHSARNHHGPGNSRSCARGRKDHGEEKQADANCCKHRCRRRKNGSQGSPDCESWSGREKRARRDFKAGRRLEEAVADDHQAPEARPDVAFCLLRARRDGSRQSPSSSGSARLRGDCLPPRSAEILQLSIG